MNWLLPKIAGDPLAIKLQLLGWASARLSKFSFTGTPVRGLPRKLPIFHVYCDHQPILPGRPQRAAYNTRCTCDSPGRRHMRRASTKITSDKRIHISPETRALYRKRDTSVDNADPDAPVLPPELWENAIVGKFYRPKKTAITFRIDNDVLRWLKSKGKGHLSRINEILRQHMTGELKS